MLSVYIPTRRAPHVRTTVSPGSGIVGRPGEAGYIVIDYEGAQAEVCSRSEWQRHVVRAAERAGNGASDGRLEVPMYELIPVGTVDDALQLRIDPDADVEQTIAGWIGSSD